jgi:hypothetical protein
MVTASATELSPEAINSAPLDVIPATYTPTPKNIDRTTTASTTVASVDDMAAACHSIPTPPLHPSRGYRFEKPFKEEESPFNACVEAFRLAGSSGTGVEIFRKIATHKREYRQGGSQFPTKVID